MGAGEPTGTELADLVQRRLFRVGMLSNGIGAVIAALFLAFLVPVSGSQANPSPGNLIRNLIGGALYLGLTLWIGTKWAKFENRSVDRWLRAERPATEEERDAVLRVPYHNARVSASLWGGAAILFGAFNYQLPGTVVVIAFITLVLGGMTTAAVDYLLTERFMRPATARALASGPPSRPVTLGVSARMLTAWVLATGVPVLGLATVAFVQLVGDNSDPQRAAGATLLLAGLGLGVGLLAITVAARSVADPVAAVREALSRVEAGDFDARVPVDDASEVGMLEAGFNRMAAGLKERERLRDLFGRHVGKDVAHAALQREIRLGGEEREIAALFVDLVGSTALAARRPPGEVVELLNRFFRAVVETVEARRGLVNKFEGDAALCIFGAPVESENPAADALAAARSLRAAIQSQLPGCDIGIGVSAGIAVAGNVGAEHRYEYTVIGDPVNEAARLCDMAKQRPERLLASETAVTRAGGDEAERWSLGQPVVLRGRDSATRLATVA